MWLACPTKGLTFLSRGPAQATSSSLLFSFPLHFLGDGQAGKVPGVQACLQPGAPSLAESGEVGGLCVLAQCAGMYGLCGTCLLGMC